MDQHEGKMDQNEGKIEEECNAYIFLLLKGSVILFAYILKVLSLVTDFQGSLTVKHGKFDRTEHIHN